MASRYSVSVIAGALVFAASGGSAMATNVDVRDAAGGTNSLGATPGLFLAPTGSRLHGRSEAAPVPKDFASGAFGFEKRVAGSADPWQMFMTYCFEPDQPIEFGANPGNLTGVTYKQAALTAQPGITAAEAVQLEKLWFNALADSKTSAVKAAAFQAIVWELGSTDAAYNLAAGNFQVVGAQGDMFEEMVKTQADMWFAQIPGWMNSTPLDVLLRQSSQNLLIPRDDPPVIPLPTSVMLAGAGLSGLGLRRRRAM